MYKKIASYARRCRIGGNWRTGAGHGKCMATIFDSNYLIYIHVYFGGLTRVAEMLLVACLFPFEMCWRSLRPFPWTCQENRGEIVFDVQYVCFSIGYIS